MTITLVRPGPPAPPPASLRWRIRRLGRTSFGPLILSASIVVALGRLMTHDVSMEVLVPLFAAVVTADVVTAVAMRFRAQVLLAIGIGWVVALCGLVLVVDPSFVNPASPHFLHGSLLSDQLRVAHGALANDGTPLPTSSGLILIFGAIGAAAAALTRGVWGRQRRVHAVDRGQGPLSPCLAPSLAIFIYSTLVSAEQGRVAAIVSYFLGLLVFIGLADRTTGPVPSASLAGQRDAALPPRRRPRFSAGALVGSLVMALVVIAAGAGLSGMRLTVFHVTAPKVSSTTGPSDSGQGAPEHLITGISLVDHLLATEVSESHTVIFRGTSPVTTYWQVGTLSSFNGTTWLPDRTVRAALSGAKGSLGHALSAGSLPSPIPAQTFTAQVAITDFASRLLPAPPHTVAVNGRPGAAVIGEEGVLDAATSAPGTTYTVTSALDTAIAGGGAQLAPFDPRLAPYLALPTEPSVVTFLAREAAGLATTPASEAQALVNWFRSGRFRYTLSPPPTSGSDPLVQFLTVTKAGFCEQFAGAYGVLARALGIPTRLAVGFTAGQAGAGGVFTVTGADAHVWPQVYLGPAAGWVSVEPTPPSVAGSPAAEGVVGATGAKAPTNGVKGTPTSAVPQTTTVTTQPRPQPSGSRPGRPPHHPHAGAPPGGLRWWVYVIVGAGLVGLIGLATWWWRRRRASLEAALPPDQRVVRAWERALGALQRKGLARRAEETPGEYAARMQVAEHASLPIEAEAVATLAALVELACYTARPCTPAQAADAHALAARIVSTNRSHRRRHRRQRARHARYQRQS